MKKPDYDAEVAANIHAARTYQGTPPDAYLVPYRNIAHLLEMHVKTSPDKAYLIHYDQAGERDSFSYAQVQSRARQVAHVLVHRLGVKRGDRVATLGYNHSDMVFIYLACWLIGACVAPQNLAEDDERIGYILRNSEAVVVLARADTLVRAETIIHGETPIESIRAIVQVDGLPDGNYLHLPSALPNDTGDFTPPETVTLEDEALLIYTSGTTGHPKGVVLIQYNLFADAMAMADWHAITPDQRLMCVLPIHHANGIMVTLFTPLYAGASTVLTRAYSASKFWQRIAAENVQIVSVVPTLLQYSLGYAESAQAEGRSIWGEGVSREDLAGFRHFICGAGTLAVSLAKRFEETFDFRINHGYGLSETTCYSCFLPTDLNKEAHRDWLTAYGYPSIGVPIRPNEMGIFDASGSGEQLGPEERGEICIRGHNVMKHYYRRPDINAETFRFAWFRSGDEGFYKVDREGRHFFFITGRIKELINRSGVKFSPFDIEEILLEIPGIHTGLAVAFENTFYGEEVGAYVVLEEGADLTANAIIAYCRERTTFEKSPKVVVFGTDIPITSTGKYQRLKLQALFSQWKNEQFRP